MHWVALSCRILRIDPPTLPLSRLQTGADASCIHLNQLTQGSLMKAGLSTSLAALLLVGGCASTTATRETSSLMSAPFSIK
jgi:hypothetical protein